LGAAGIRRAQLDSVQPGGRGMMVSDRSHRTGRTRSVGISMPVQTVSS
jgi:hypothetical protein